MAEMLGDLVLARWTPRVSISRIAGYRFLPVRRE